MRCNNYALALLLSAQAFEYASCWTVGSNSPRLAQNIKQHGLISQKITSNTALNGAANPMQDVMEGTSESLTNAIAAAADVESIGSGIFSPIKNILSKIIEAENTLSDMEHSAASNTAKALLSLIDSIDSSTSSLTSSAINGIPKETLQQIVSSAVESAKLYAQSIDDSLLSTPILGPALTTIQNQVGALSPIIGNELASLPPSVGIVASAAITYTIVSTVLSIGQGPPPSSPYPLGRYDAGAARAFFDERIGEVIARAVEIASLSTQFGLKLLNDYFSKKLDENAEKRAEELSALLTRLGPTFIKIGQSLSIRTDLLSPAYVRGLKMLQDQVPPFPTSEAKEIIEEELGQPISTLFDEFSPEPVAAASLGQVYKARLRSNGKEVAIKVQRPDIMNQIAVDMHILRELAPWAKRTFNLNTDTTGTVDAWGLGFVDELDYISEAENAEYFTESIQGTPLAGVAFAPPVVEDCTTGKVLTTEWIDGERLDRSSNEDVTILCSIAMNSYLTMMLETGVLHCDPHPGNLLRTPDGRLCILDWGMVTRLNPDLQVTLIEHMAHLTSADYEEIPRDLLLLGFIPENKAGLIRDSGIVEVLADIYGAWTAGGGAASINVNKVVAQLQDLTAAKGNLFQIPPYFAYIAKSFSVLEGIGLSNNPKYSIINECLPYVSKRLLTDQSERTGGALSTFIFGPSKNDADRIVDYDRVEQLISGFGSYTTSTSGVQVGQEKTRGELIDEFTEQVLDLLVTEEETPLQTIFIDQVAKVISSSSRSVWTDLRERSGKLPSGRTVLGTVVDPLGLFRTSPVVRMNELDERTMDTARNLVNLLGAEVQAGEENSTLDPSTLTPAETQEILSSLTRKVWSRRNSVLKTGNRLATKLLQLTADKLETGERDVLVLPPPVTSDSDVVQQEPVLSSNAINAVPASHQGNSAPKSARMQNALKILQGAENEETFN